jgi:hypothetical protein
MGVATYQGHEAGLYPGSTNLRTLSHLASGLLEAQGVVPRLADGTPDSQGRIVLVSIGMSNTNQEFGTFVDLVNADADVSSRVKVVNGAQGGQTAATISNPLAAFWGNVDQKLGQAGVTPEQVQVVWLKEANARPMEPFPQHAEILQGQLGAIMGIIRDRYPNTRLAYCSSRIYAGYATTELNPEPYAYESGFSVRWLIEDQMAGDPVLNFDATAGPVEAPWISWGPYLWADGLTPRSDGLVWECSDLSSDGTHPAGSGRQKVAAMLLDFFKTDATTRGWFLGDSAASFAFEQDALVGGARTEFRGADVSPGDEVVFFGTRFGEGMGPCPPPFGGLCLGLLAPVKEIGRATADASGIAFLTRRIPRRGAGIEVHTQAVVSRGAASLASRVIRSRVLPGN